MFATLSFGGRMRLRLLLLVAAIGCASAPGKQPAVSNVQATGAPAAANCLTAKPGPGFRINPPPKAAEFTVVKSETFSPELGVMRRYRAPDFFWLDVFFYPAPRGCDFEMADSLVRMQARGFVESIPRYIERGYYSDAKVRRIEKLTPGARDEWLTGRYVSLEVTSKGNREYEEFLLYYLDGLFLKMRVTIKPDPALVKRVADFPAWYIPLVMSTKIEDGK
jgi:hypothetical protein